MNAKTAKKLRKIAMGMVVAAEEQGKKDIPKVSYRQDKRGTIAMDKACFRSAYQALKEGVLNKTF